MEGNAIGIDPGVNYGITYIMGGKVFVRNGKLPTPDAHGGTRRMMYGQMAALLVMSAPRHQADLIALEDAAFNKTFGQVGLAEVRFGFWYGLKIATGDQADIQLLPPMTARKLAFGDGRTQASDIWPLLNHNGADSLGLAMAALKGR